MKIDLTPLTYQERVNAIAAYLAKIALGRITHRGAIHATDVMKHFKLRTPTVAHRVDAIALFSRLLREGLDELKARHAAANPPVEKLEEQPAAGL